MKIRIAFLASALTLSGCAVVDKEVAKLPTNAVETWTHSINYGPFFARSFTVTGANKQPDGSIKVGNYIGSFSVLGVFNVSDSLHDLTIAPKKPDAK